MRHRQVPDARQRLAHVLKLTDDAAHHTMDLVDQSCPLVDAVVALRGGMSKGFGNSVDALFHDEEIDGPLASRTRVFALTLDAERPVVSARVAGLDDVDVVGAEDVGEAGSVPLPAGRAEQQLATLAVRLEMAAVYLRLLGG